MRYLGKELMLGLALSVTSCSATTGRLAPSTPTLTQPSTKAGTPTSVTDPLCSLVKIVHLSRLDTTGTKEQVEANNAVLTEVCHAND